MEQVAIPLKTIKSAIISDTLQGCKFANHCRYYEKDAHTCNDEKEAKSYCGARAEFEEYLNRNKREKEFHIADLFAIKMHDYHESTDSLA